MSPDRASVGEEGVHFCRAFPTALGNLQLAKNKQTNKQT